MAVAGWIADKSAVARSDEPPIERQFDDLDRPVYVCGVGQLELLFSARSARDYDELVDDLRHRFLRAESPADLLDRALALQRDLAHHHALWHRIPIPDLIIAETALFHGYGVLHVDADYDRIAEVRPLVSRRLG